MNISIISAVYNAEKTVGECLASVGRQAGANRERISNIDDTTSDVALGKVELEHIIVDGGSTDGTKAVVEGARTSGMVVSSEPDQGIYDALNKGIRSASGDVVGILHADDVFAHDRVLARVAAAFEDPGVDACYGDLVYVGGRGMRDGVRRYWRSGSFERRKFWWGWMPPHPTFFVRRRVYEELGGFRLDLGTAADYELMLRFLVKNELRVAYLPEVLVAMRVGGMSNRSVGNRLRANRMDRKAWEVNGLRPYPWTIPLKPLRKLPQWWRRPP